MVLSPGFISHQYCILHYFIFVCYIISGLVSSWVAGKCLWFYHLVLFPPTIVSTLFYICILHYFLDWFLLG